MILKVARIGNPILRSPARPVPAEMISSPELQRLVDDMIETMHECDHFDGSVYLDCMEGLRTLSFLREFERYVNETE